MQVLEKKNDERIVSVDVLRGISLFGIFLVNMLSFHSPYFYYNPYEWWKTSEDIAIFSWIDVFVQASFYPIFATLFGFGAAMQYEKAQQRSSPFLWGGIRRFAFLLLLGILHAFLIWPGDILVMYAVSGFLLLGCLRFSGRVLLLAGITLWFVPAVWFSAMLLLAALSSPYNGLFWTDIASVSESIAAYGSGSFAEVTAQRIKDWMNNNVENGAFWFQLVAIFPFLLIGAGACKLRLIEKGLANPKRAAGLFVFLFFAGLSLKGIPHMLDPNHIAYMYIQDSVGGPVLGASYAVLIVLLCAFKRPVKILQPFAAAGKMSLTNYLTQSVLGSLLFYSYGLGYYGQVTAATGTLLCLAVFTVQIVGSNSWLSHFQRGPAEILWRKVTYGKRRR